MRNTGRDWQNSTHCRNMIQYQNSTDQSSITDCRNTTGDWIWFPLILRTDEEIISKLKLKSSTFFTSSIDLIVHRDELGVVRKIKTGLFQCRYLFLICLALSIIFAVLIWLIEQWKNRDFPSSCSGIFIGWWLGLVTMTTVGFGDVTPKSILGKLLTMSWMISGVLMSAILTSTLTNAFNGVDYLEVYDKEIVANNWSMEAWTAEQHYSAKIIPLPNYETLYEALEKKMYTRGIVNTDFNWHHRAKYPSIRTVKLLQSVVDVAILYSEGKSKVVKKLIENCLSIANWYDIIVVSVNKHRGFTKTHSLAVEEDIIEFVTQNTVFFSFIVIAALLLFLGVALGMIFHLRKIRKIRSSGACSSCKNTGTHSTGSCRENIQQTTRKGEIDELKNSMNENLALIREDLLSLKTTLEFVKTNMRTIRGTK